MGDAIQDLQVCQKATPIFKAKGKASNDLFTSGISASCQNPSSFKTNEVNGTVVGIGRNFEGNHLFGVTPADNAIAISDSGLIVSIDNSTITYFKDNGDTIVKFGIPIVNWYKDSTFDQQPFDPRLIYDRVEDSFIAVMIYFSQDYTDSRILVSFSQALALDSVAWNHFL